MEQAAGLESRGNPGGVSMMNVIGSLFSRKWILATLLVIAATGVMVRLGFWQLERLEQRRAFNARVQAQIDQPPLELAGAALQADLHDMEYRQVRAKGTYDHGQQVALRNQALDGRWGVHLVTPLKIEGSQLAVLVDRGWIPAEVYESGDWSRYNEAGEVTVEGVIRRSRERADFGPRSDAVPGPGGEPLKAWNFINVPALDAQIEGELLPVYIQQAPAGLAPANQAPDEMAEASSAATPVRTQPEIELTEGSHQGYAIQWFTFAGLLFFGYPIFVKRSMAESRRATGEDQP